MALLELGVCRAEQYADHAAGPGYPSGQIRWAYSLLRTSNPPSPAEIEMFEGIMEDLCHSMGVYRTTTAQRFESLDAFVMPILEAHFPRQTPLLAADWAASACITSAEWYQLLAQSFPGSRLTASDLHLYLVEIRLPGGRESFIVEPEGFPLQYIRPPFVIPLNQRESRRLPVNLWLQMRAMKRFERLKKQGNLEWDGAAASQDEWQRPPLVFRRIPLIHPTAVALGRSCPAFRIEKHSIFEPRLELSHVIRTMNILNHFYFNAGQLTACMRNIWSSLEMKGLWIVGRTFEERKQQIPAVHDASVLEKTPEGFRLVDRHRAPSEVEDLALALRI